MRTAAAHVVLAACAIVGCVACGATATSPSPISSSTGAATISFSGLTVNGAAVSTYTESGFSVSAASGDWSARTDYGAPAPFVQFWAASGTTVTGEIRVKASGPVYFKSVDLYSSITPIPYVITGFRNGTTVFTVTDTIPMTYGHFRTVFNPHAADPVDALSITLTNPGASCCRNPMGLDTIVLTSAPSTAPNTFSLRGQVTDAATGAGIPSASVSVQDGPNAGTSTGTDASGSYTLTDLQQSGFSVSAYAGNYLSQAKGVTLTSDQTLSFQLTRRAAAPVPPPPPSGAIVIGFDGLVGNRTSVSTYTESGFTVSATAGAWESITTFGHPAPFIQFSAPAGTTVTGQLQVVAGGSAFSFHSVDLYASTTRIPYAITGLRNGSPVFTLTDTVPNTFGDFRTVTNPSAAASIDALAIVLTNAAAACCSNPMGLDTIVLTR